MIFNSQGLASLASPVRKPGRSVKAVTVQAAAAADFVLMVARWADIENAPGGLPGTAASPSTASISQASRASITAL